jgi:hypothetical protein
MRKFTVLGVLILLFFGTTNVFSQQFLWSTSNEITDEKYLPIEDVKGKVLEYYDNYNFYVDQTGYNEEGFIEKFEMESTIKRLKEVLNKSGLNSLVFCVKTNSGSSSVISVIIMGKKNFDVISFTNGLLVGVQPTGTNFKGKFEKWFNTLME